MLKTKEVRNFFALLSNKKSYNKSKITTAIQNQNMNKPSLVLTCGEMVKLKRRMGARHRSPVGYVVLHVH